MLLKIGVGLLGLALVANVVVSCKRDARFLKQCLEDGKKQYECEYMRGVMR